MTQAQSESKSVKTLVIDNGKVWINNNEIASDNIPSNLDLRGLTLESHFIGVGQPLINLGGIIFSISENGLQNYQTPQQNYANSYAELSVQADKQMGPTRQDNLRMDYLRRLENSNQMLYRWLTEENRLDLQTKQLAEEIRLTKNSNKKSVMIEKLFVQLNAIFDLKQKNRLAEISHLELQLEELRSRFEKRESMRRSLIENRIQELVGN